MWQRQAFPSDHVLVDGWACPYSGKGGLPRIPPIRREEGEPRADCAGLILSQRSIRWPQGGPGSQVIFIWGTLGSVVRVVSMGACAGQNSPFSLLFLLLKANCGFKGHCDQGVAFLLPAGVFPPGKDFCLDTLEGRTTCSPEKAQTSLLGAPELGTLECCHFVSSAACLLERSSSLTSAHASREAGWGEGSQGRRETDTQTQSKKDIHRERPATSCPAVGASGVPP